MRAALGASSGRLFRQLVTESVVLAFCGGALGVAVAELVLRGLMAASPPGLPRVDAIRLDGQVLLFAIAVTTLVGLAMGVLPALSAAFGRADSGLHRGTRTVAGGRSATRNVLVVAEVALALVLLINAGLLLRTMRSILAVPAGFDGSHVVTLQITEAGHAFDSTAAQLQFLQQTLDAVRRTAGVKSASFTSQLPLSGDIDGYGFEALSVPDSRGGGLGSAMRFAVTPDYFATLGIPLRAGRFLDATDRPNGARSVVINATMAKKLFRDRNPLGEQMRFGPEMNDTTAWHTIVGVVGDVKHYSLVADAPDAFYVVARAVAVGRPREHARRADVRRSGGHCTVVEASRLVGERAGPDSAYSHDGVVHRRVGGTAPLRADGDRSVCRRGAVARRRRSVRSNFWWRDRALP